MNDPFGVKFPNCLANLVHPTPLRREGGFLGHKGHNLIDEGDFVFVRRAFSGLEKVSLSSVSE